MFSLVKWISLLALHNKSGLSNIPGSSMQITISYFVQLVMLLWITTESHFFRSNFQLFHTSSNLDFTTRMSFAFGFHVNLVNRAFASLSCYPTCKKEQGNMFGVINHCCSSHLYWYVLIFKIFFYFWLSGTTLSNIRTYSWTFTKDNLQQNENYNLNLTKKKPDTIKNISGN